MVEKVIRVGMADDDALVRRVLGTLLGSSPQLEMRWTVQDGAEAVEAATDPEREVDVLLVDLHMPEMNGLQVLEELGATRPELPVVLLTTSGEAAHIVDALERGARGYFVKDDDPLLIADGLVRVVAGGHAFSPSASNQVVEMVRSGRGMAAPVSQDSRPMRDANLTARETQVLTLVAQSLSNKEIARKLTVSEATVKTHVSVLISKLGVRDRVGAAVWAHRNGLV